MMMMMRNEQSSYRGNEEKRRRRGLFLTPEFFSLSLLFIFSQVKDSSLHSLVSSPSSPFLSLSLFLTDLLLLQHKKSERGKEKNWTGSSLRQESSLTILLPEK